MTFKKSIVQQIVIHTNNRPYNVYKHEKVSQSEVQGNALTIF